MEWNYMLLRRGTGVWLSVILGACSGPPSVRPAPSASSDAGMDASAAADLGLERDAGFEDAQPAPDAEARDLGPPDLGPIDPPDAGLELDAGAPDVGVGDQCFPMIVDPSLPTPNYDQFNPTIGSHCYGTNHQNITGVERVVFLGDSVTVGTPPTESADYYRSQLADRLAARFGLEPPSNLWKRPNLLDGTSLIQDSGDFSSCAKWGARTDDLLVDNQQILDCFPEDTRNLRTLVIMTMGGNDIASITKSGAEGTPVAEVWLEAERTVLMLRQAIEWFYDDPSKFPNGVFVIFANPFEFTDGTGDVTSCPAAAAAGFDEPWADPDALAQIVVWLDEQYMDIAVSTQTDMAMLLENFCGHGFLHDDPSARCYLGPGAERWFDVSCIHPNPVGHGVIADMFMAIVDE